MVLEVDEAVYLRLAAREANHADERVWSAFREMAVLASHPQGFLLGHPSDDCLDVLHLNGEVVDSVCHEWLERRPIRTDDLDGWPELQTLMRTFGVTPELPEYYPPFDRVFVQEDAILVYRTQTSDQLSVLRQFSDEGGRETVFQIPPAPEVFISGGSVLGIWYDLSGTWIGVYDAVGG